MLLQDYSFQLGSLEVERGSAISHQLISTYMLIVLKSGAGRLLVDYKEYDLQPDSIYFIRPGQTVGMVKSQSADPVSELYICRFDASERLGKEITDDEIHFMAERTAVEYCYRIQQSMLQHDITEQLHAQFIFAELLYSLCKSSLTDASKKSDTTLEKVKMFIDQHFDQPLSIQQLAVMTDLSPNYFAELFKRRYGKSAIDYLTETRIQFAKQQILHSGAKLREVALRAGYNDEFYFSRMFKKQTGVSPTVYIKTRRRKLAVYDFALLGNLLALGIIPFAAPLHPKWTSYYSQKYFSEIPVHLSAYRFNEDWQTNQQILRNNKPELILCQEELLQKEELESLQLIAPVVALPTKQVHWRSQFLWIAEKTSTLPEAKQYLKQYDDKLKHAKLLLHPIINQLGGNVGAVSLYKQRLSKSNSRGTLEMLFNELELEENGFLQQLHKGTELTLNQLQQYDPAVLFVNVCQESETLLHWKKVQQSADWADLQAVRKQQCYVITSDPWREYSAYAFKRKLDQLLELLVDE